MTTVLYIYEPNGFAADLISTSSATGGVTGKRGDNLALYVIFHDGMNPVELPADAMGSFTVKAQKGFAGAAVMGAGAWAKQAGAGAGYLFTLVIAGTALDQLLGAMDGLALICEVSWMTGGVRTTTPTIPFTVLNNLCR